MENNGVNIEKVPLQKLIDILVEMYNNGVDYIDITGVKGEKKDYMAIGFNKEYMCPEAQENFDKIPNTISEEDITKRKLSDEDINDLI